MCLRSPKFMSGVKFCAFCWSEVPGGDGGEILCMLMVRSPGGDGGEILCILLGSGIPAVVERFQSVRQKCSREHTKCVKIHP